MTKRIPGARRGRPRKAKPPKSSKSRGGARRKPLEHIGLDRDRHAVALADAMLGLGIAESENAACEAVAALRIGSEIEPVASGWTSWQKRTEPGIAATFAGHATTLRNKRRKYADAVSMQWRQAMARACSLALTSADAPNVKLAVRALASSVGEAAFAERVLFAMIDAARVRGELRTTSMASDFSVV